MSPKAAKTRPPDPWLDSLLARISRERDTPTGREMYVRAEGWATRPMLRLWRECAAQLWPHWPVAAAVAYSQKRRHDGDIYRWDGWKLLSDNCGRSGGGGAWNRPRYSTAAASGPKRLWAWTFEAPA